MKKLYWIIGSIITLMASFAALQTVASERIEVVELQTVNIEGETIITRLWVVDYEGRPYLRAGYEGSGWYIRIKANQNVMLTRQGETHRYSAEADPDAKEEIENLMQNKYTWGDTYIGMIFGRDDSVPVKLTKI